VIIEHLTKIRKDAVLCNAGKMTILLLQYP
jgi:hypothetical protein